MKSEGRMSILSCLTLACNHTYKTSHNELLLVVGDGVVDTLMGRMTVRCPPDPGVDRPVQTGKEYSAPVEHFEHLGRHEVCA